MAKSIMIQGTMSGAGKSLLVTGLCRIFKQDGYRAAPFKSQNMALNSFITEENLEMGRAQAVQAFACGIKPNVSMNPILLKPTTDMGSQVIVNGEVQGNMRAMEYFRRKKEYIPVILEAYAALKKEYDIIVIEGAGSPAEINLKQDDIVNMGLAKLVDAPVLLAGDIDRGGVFAQLIGTVMLLEKEEQDRIKGLIINKFRGDRRILEPGLEMLYERCGKEVLGVVPMADVDIEEEDSLAPELSRKNIGGNVDIAVIRFPRISNFTDFQALQMERAVSVRYVEKVCELGNPDMVILPGTKNTIQDLMWLRQSGLEAAILKQVQKKCLLFGICGGYQMLGREIIDEEGIEGEAGGRIRGMGLLPVTTCFVQSKTRTRRAGITGALPGCLQSLSCRKVSGYEIHMGRTFFSLEDSAERTVYFADMKMAESEYDDQGLSAPADRCVRDGFVRDRVLGTYLHGVFDEGEFRRALIKLLCEEKGISCEEVPEVTFQAYREEQYDRLAAVLRENLNMKSIYHIMK